MPRSAAAIIPAAGFGTRMNLDQPKQYHLLAGVPILVHTVRGFRNNIYIGPIVVVVPADRLEMTKDLLTEYGLADSAILVTAGGRRRQDSVFNGLNLLDDSADIVLVHDGARPLIPDELISRCYHGAVRHGAVIAAIPVKDTLKQCTSDLAISKTVDRSDLWQAQTPQAAEVRLLKQAYSLLGDRDVTDEASLLEFAGIPVRVVEGSETNIKITRPEDLFIAEKIMQNSRSGQTRIGHGFDAHRLVPARKLILGGVEIPHDRGLDGHSDADVLTHSLCDAILGALGEGDIGRHFPDTDDRYRGAYSISLLEKVTGLMQTKGFHLANADITLVCQAPRIAPFIVRMTEILAGACQTRIEQINVKATTTEKMGFTGRMEGISCHAVVLLKSTH
jgi:2-C-methyl-D-erythritol 4-phosphate cytidylyltransferase / 2-C-methyl-D-erythritol 2,4-cyclodiphosphate synthase